MGPDQSKEEESYRLKQKVKCKSCNKTIELDKPVRLLKASGAVRQVSASKIQQKCPVCGNQHEYSLDEVQNLIE